MKYISLFLLLVFASTCTNTSQPTEGAKEQTSYNEQLYVFSDAGSAESCGMAQHDSLLFGGMLLTEKGHVIISFETLNEDSTRCYWGDYQLQDKNIVYTLKHVSSFKGQWSADLKNRGNVVIRDIAPISDTLYATHCANELGFFRRFAKEEISLYNISGAPRTPTSLYYMPYNAIEDQKFFTWFFRSIPELADL